MKTGEPIVDIALDILTLGGGGASVVAFLLLISRAAIAKAINHAADRELEGLRGRSAKQLAKARREHEAFLATKQHEFEIHVETRRQAFTRSLHDERIAAERGLEQFKAELTLAAEVRRQVATRQVEALVRIYREGNALIQTVWARTGQFDDKGEKALYSFLTTVRDLDFLLPPDLVQKFYEYRSAIDMASTRAQTGQGHAEYKKVIAASETFLEAVRRALGVIT